MAGMRGWTIGIGAISATACVAGAWLTPTDFLYSYLIAYLYWLGLSLGSLGLLMVQHLSGGAWGFVVRRPLEAAARLAILMAVLFVPLAAGLPTLYPWARPEVVAADPVLQDKQLYLSVPFFLVRAALYFAAWIALAWLLGRWSREQDERGEEPAARRMQALSAGGLAIFVLTVTFASIDWIMSLEPHWFSTIFGLIVISSQGLSAVALAILVLAALARRDPVARVAIPARFHDLGNFTLMLVMVWAYLSFSQFLIIWSGNLPEEVPWYVHRAGVPWQGVGVALVLFHFVVPFALLLSRRTKQASSRLVPIAVGLLVMRLVELVWIVGPERSPERFHVSWLDLAAPIAMGSLWVGLFVRELSRQPLLPRHGDEGAYDVPSPDWRPAEGHSD